MTNISDIWVYLSQTPLLWLTLTLIVYQIAYAIYEHFDARAILNPVLLSVAIVITVLFASGTNYSTYFEGAKFIHFLLGPATVALAIPLYSQKEKLKEIFLPLLGALMIGSFTAIMSVVFIGNLLGLSREVMLSMLPKSVTAPIAMGISEQIAGLPSLTGVMVIFTGVTGAILAPVIFKIINVSDHSIRGVAIGLTSHGIGTARAFQISTEKGAFAGLAMGLNAAVSAILVPVIVWLLGL